jgi:hypothetical protein
MNSNHFSDENLDAKDLRVRLREDPAYLARMTNDERELKRLHQAQEEYLRAASPLLEELANKGYFVEQLSDLYRRKKYANQTTFQQVVPILLRWLAQLNDLRVKDDIVRTLTIKWAKPVAAPGLIIEFLHAPDDSTSSSKWAVGNALSVVADDSVFEDIVKIVQDRRHGKAREMVAVTLGNMKDPRAVDVLIDLLHDEEVAGHALLALGKLKPGRAKASIEPFLTHPKAWVRKAARSALAKIEKAA